MLFGITHHPDSPVDYFNWTVLTGPNGIGKSQLAMELGRHLAQRELFGDANEIKWQKHLQILRSWWQRVVCFFQIANPRWDVGIIRQEQIEKLAAWRPRVYTLLILDDPAPDVTKKVLDKLHEQKDQYWWPVRLIIIDRFIPAGCPIHYNPGEAKWQHENNPQKPFTYFTLNEQRFGLEELRHLRSGYVWQPQPNNQGYLEIPLNAIGPTYHRSRTTKTHRPAGRPPITDCLGH